MKGCEIVKILIKINSTIYKLENGEWEDSGLTEPISEADMDLYGVEVDSVTSEEWGKLTSEFTLIGHTEDESAVIEINTNPQMPIMQLLDRKLVAWSEDDTHSFNVITQDNKLDVNAVPKAQVIKPTGDIDITGVEVIKHVTLDDVESGGGMAKVAISVDSGSTYKVWRNNQWKNVNVNNTDDFISLGMTRNEINEVTPPQFNVLRNGSNTIRFAYLLNRPTYDAQAEHVSITLSIALEGTTEVADPDNYTITFDTETNEVTYIFNTDGTYTIAYA